MKKMASILMAVSVAASGVAFSATAPTATAPTTAGQFSPVQQAAIGDIIHTYLVKNPEVLIEAMQAFQAKQAQKQVDAAIPKIQANVTGLFHDTQTPTAGNKAGKVAFVEFYDFRCPHCKEATKSVENLMKANPNLKVIYKDFPIFGGASLTAAKASIAAYKLNPVKYSAFHHALMATKDGLTDASIMDLAKQSGYNVKALQKAMAQPWVDNQIKANIKLGTSIGVNATPMFVIGNLATGKYAFVPGAYPQKMMQAKITSVQN